MRHLDDGVKHHLKFCRSFGNSGQIGDRFNVTQFSKLGLVQQIQADHFGFVGEDLHRDRGEHRPGSCAGHADRNTEDKK